MDETESVYIKLFCSNKLRVALFDFWKSRWLTHRVWASFSSLITCRLTNLNRPLQAASGQKPGDPNCKSKVHQLVILLFQMYILRNRFGLVKWSFIWDAHLDSDFNFRLPGTYQVLNTDFIISPSASFLLIFLSCTCQIRSPIKCFLKWGALKFKVAVNWLKVSFGRFSRLWFAFWCSTDGSYSGSFWSI